MRSASLISRPLKKLIMGFCAALLACNCNDHRKYEVGFFFPELDILLDQDVSSKSIIPQVLLECDSRADVIVTIASACEDLLDARSTEDMLSILADNCLDCERSFAQNLERQARQVLPANKERASIPIIKLLADDSKVLILNWSGSGILAIATPSHDEAISVVRKLFTTLDLYSKEVDIYRPFRCSEQDSMDFFAVQELSSENHVIGLFVIGPNNFSNEYLVIVRQISSVSQFFAGISTFALRSDVEKLFYYWQLEYQQYRNSESATNVD